MGQHWVSAPERCQQGVLAMSIPVGWQGGFAKEGRVWEGRKGQNWWVERGEDLISRKWAGMAVAADAVAKCYTPSQAMETNTGLLGMMPAK